MSVGFGFSAGDFIAALNLVSTVIDALRDSGSASLEYRELVRELYTLEQALFRVKRIELDESQILEQIALKQAASQCHRTIDEFWRKVRKYQPHLGQEMSSPRIKSGWMRIKWALCKEDDLAKFKADLQGHTSSIEVLLLTVQMNAATFQSRKNDQAQRTLCGRIQDASFETMNRLANITDAVTSGIQQGKQLLDMTVKIMRINFQVFQMLCNIENFITRIPGQVELQQPVYLMDALGKMAPFHLEFVRSAEAFISVLRINFSKVGSGAEKIDRGEFAIQESSTKRQIDLHSDWETCFLPGQRVDMSMIFRRTILDHSICPGCAGRRTVNRPEEDEAVECLKCGMTYSHQAVQCIGITPFASRPSIVPVNARDAEFQVPGLRRSNRGLGPFKRKREYDADEEMRHFRRVRIVDETKKGADAANNLIIGAEVAYDLPGSGWILCIVIAIIYDEHIKQYEVQDCDPDEKGMPGQIYRASAANLIAITPLDEYVRHDYPIGGRGLARYPDTTCFFPATVEGSVNGSRLVKLKFDGDDDHIVEVDARYILDGYSFTDRYDNGRALQYQQPKKRRRRKCQPLPGDEVLIGFMNGLKNRTETNEKRSDSISREPLIASSMEAGRHEPSSPSQFFHHWVPPGSTSKKKQSISKHTHHAQSI